jgi:hypothetical protein
MTKYHYVINSDITLSTCIGLLREAYKEFKYLKISVKRGHDRSLDQNAISHAWYEQISKELREQTVLQVKAQCKLMYGVPIMRAEDDDFREAYDTRIKNGFSFEQKLILMESFPVTSLMTKAQLSQYLTAMQTAYAGKVALEFPKCSA